VPLTTTLCRFRSPRKSLRLGRKVAMTLLARLSGSAAYAGRESGSAADQRPTARALSGQACSLGGPALQARLLNICR